MDDRSDVMKSASTCPTLARSWRGLEIISVSQNNSTLCDKTYYTFFQALTSQSLSTVLQSRRQLGTIMHHDLGKHDRSHSSIHPCIRFKQSHPIITKSPTVNTRVSVLNPRSESLHSRPRNNIADQVVVDINQNARISPLVESRRARTAGSLGTTTANHCTQKSQQRIPIST
jgi:hypothetical protein